MSKEMREQINKVKNWKQFNEGYVNSVNIEKYLFDLIQTKNKIDEMTGDDEDNQKFYELRKTKEFNNLYNKWISLIEDIKEHYKRKLESEFVKNGETGVKKLHKDIVDFLKQNEYEDYTGVIWFDLTEFTRNLIKKGG